MSSGAPDPSEYPHAPGAPKPEDQPSGGHSDALANRPAAQDSTESYIRELEAKLWAAPSKSADMEKQWPFPEWKRYEFRSFIGQGAMGQVFSVFDPVLNRTVAMKVLSEKGMRFAILFLEEARAQARVEHPHVAKVHEVGEEQGRPYITMQLLNGESLQTLHEKLRMEEKVEILRQTCEGVQAAHATGLLHRDLKPANIVVDKDNEGRWHAYVVDFGMACEGGVAAAQRRKDQANHGEDEDNHAKETQEEVVGTPAYMSPEQAASDPLDRRSDVFSLGSTLYFVLTGQLPFGGESLLSTMGKVSLAAPESPRKFNAAIPEDLEAILRKAMAKSPADRYPSAKALGQDLKRWLDGDLVEAMEKSRLYRVGRWASKNRLLASSLLLLCLTLAGTGFWTLRQQARAKRQAYYHQYFAQEAELMESTLALAETVPLHDTLPERESIREQMKHLEQVMNQAGSVAEAPGLLAIGRGHMLCEDWAAARKTLERAWALGLQTPEVAFALGNSLIQIYQEELTGLSGTAYTANKARLDRTLKPAILSHLALAAQNPRRDQALFAEALMATLTGHSLEALRKADQVLEIQPWNVNALLLKVDNHLVLAEQSSPDGAPLAKTEDHLAKARSLLEKVQDVARSCAKAYLYEAKLHHRELSGAIQRQEPFLSHLERVLESTAKARQAHSRGALAFEREADALYVSRDNPADWYWRSRPDAQDTPGIMRRVIALTDQALALDPKAYKPHHIKGQAWWKLSELEAAKGLDPLPFLEKAIQALRLGLDDAPHVATLLGDLSTAYAVKAKAEMEGGRNPSNAFQEALRFYHQVEGIQPFPLLYYNLAYLHWDRARFQRWCGIYPEDALSQAMQASRKSLDMKRLPANRLSLAKTHLLMAQYSAWDGKNDLEALKRGMEGAEAEFQQTPQAPDATRLLATACLLHSFMGVDHQHLDRAKTLLASLPPGEGNHPETQYLVIWLALEQFRQKPDWRSYLPLERRIQEALQKSSIRPELHFLGFEACRIGWQKKASGADAEQWKERAESHLNKARHLNLLVGPEADRLLKTVRP